jgi:hypothetical protein
MIEADIGHDAVEPGGEAAIEPERMQVPVDPQEGLLVDIAGLLRRTEEVNGDAEDILVIRVDQRRKGVLIALLRRAPPRPVVLSGGTWLNGADSGAASGDAAARDVPGADRLSEGRGDLRRPARAVRG